MTTSRPESEEKGEEKEREHSLTSERIFLLSLPHQSRTEGFPHEYRVVGLK
jgi:hypothetical protein